MNVRKRGLALLMCICMIFTLLPFSAFADGEKPYKTHSDKTALSWIRPLRMTPTTRIR